jgi:SlyX protein
MDATPIDRKPSDERLAARVTELETLCTHLQRTVGELDEVVLAQQRQIDALVRSYERLAAGVESISAQPTAPLKPEDEKPPHY